MSVPPRPSQCHAFHVSPGRSTICSGSSHRSSRNTPRAVTPVTKTEGNRERRTSRALAVPSAAPTAIPAAIAAPAGQPRASNHAAARLPAENAIHTLRSSTPTRKASRNPIAGSTQ